MTTNSFGDLAAEMLSESYSQRIGCPPIEKITAAAGNELSATEKGVIEQHVIECPVCRAESALAQAYVKGSAENVDAELVADLAETLRSRQNRDRNVVQFPHRWRRTITPLVGLAAAATIALAIFPPLFVSAPGLPDRPESSILRSATVVVQQPAGELDVVPETFSWSPVSEADEYRVRIRSVDNEILWESIVSTPEYGTPADLAERLLPAVRYTWQVEALDDAGRTIARSEATSIRIRAGN